MNKIFLSGNVTRDCELKMTRSGKKVATVSIANKVSKDATQYVNVTCWENNAEYASKYVKKGCYVCIEGMLRVNVSEDASGKKTYSHDIWADRIDCPKQSYNTVTSEPVNNFTLPSFAPQDNGYAITDDDLPY